MTTFTRETILEMLSKISPWPWLNEGESDHGNLFVSSHEMRNGIPHGVANIFTYNRPIENAEFIAAAPEIITHLLSREEELMQDNERLRSDLRLVRYQIDQTSILIADRLHVCDFKENENGEYVCSCGAIKLFRYITEAK